MAERSDRRRGKAVNKRVPPEAAAAIGTRCANSMLARSREAPHQRPYIRLQPVPCRVRQGCSLTTMTLAQREESIYRLLGRSHTRSAQLHRRPRPVAAVACLHGASLWYEFSVSRTDKAVIPPGEVCKLL